MLENDKYMLKVVDNNHEVDRKVINMIIKGDNQYVLDLLKIQYEDSIKCVYIDPPYNNKEIYNHYDDNQEHAEWLEDKVNVLRKLRALLSKDGSLWISIDDSEVHYLKVAADEVFGRENFVHTIVWQHRSSRENRTIFSNNHEYILVYAKNKKEFKKVRNSLVHTDEVLSRYKNPDNDPRGPWQSVTAHVQAGHAVESQFYDIIDPNGNIHKLPNGRCWCYNKEKMQREIEANNIWFGKDGKGVPRLKKFLSQRKKGITPETLWLADEVGTTEIAKKQILGMFPNEIVFDTPKPEGLIERIIHIATNEGETVLDAYLGSGTTAAVALKMKRNFIGIEIGNQTIDLVTRRLDDIISHKTSKLDSLHKDINTYYNTFEIVEKETT